jgi:hypothetical protein
LWSATARRLVGRSFGETQLAFVGLHLSLQLSVWLLDGNTKIPVYEDPDARRDCPTDPRDVRRVRDQVARMRNDVLHHLGAGDADASITAHWSHKPPHMTLSVSRGRGGITEDSMTGEAVTEWLDLLDPWLRRQVDRLLAAAEHADSA